MNRFPCRCRLTVELLEARNLLNASSGLTQLFDGSNHGPADDPGEIRLDASGNPYYLDPVPVFEIGALYQSTATGGGGGGTSGGSGLNVPKLHSNAGATKKIFLDFDGQIISGTLWNNANNGNAIHAPAYSTDSDIANFSTSEIANIKEIWRRVAEDFAPFAVDVTTESPASTAFSAGGQAIRIMISTEYDESSLGGTGNKWFTDAGGVAYLNSWSWTSDTPAWVFYNHLGNGSEKAVAEAASHEAGHTFGLLHDGNKISGQPDNPYYAGHGSGATGWAPIMGVGYYQSLTQWSKGEYSQANNTEDDLAGISSALGYRSDDHGDNFAAATTLSVAADGAVADDGIISKSSDVDLFRIAVGAGNFSVTISPFEAADGKANLDIMAKLFNAAGQEITSSNPLSALNASFNLTLSAGTYYLQVDGVGKGNPSTTGYSDYGSLGQFSIAGTVVPSSGNNAPTAVDDTATTDMDQSVLIDVLANDSDPDGDTLTIDSTGSAANGTAVIENGKIRYTPNSGFSGSDSFTYTADDGNGGQDSATVNVTVSDTSGFINFNSETIISYGSGQDVSGSYSLSNNGRTLNLSGNTWKAIAFSYTITANTVIEFDFSSTAKGEVHGIGLDNDLSISSSYTFRVYGTQNWGRANYNNYVSGTKHYVIPIGEFYTGAAKYLFFANDHDVSNPTAQSSFGNIKIYEQNKAPVAVNDSAATDVDKAVTIDVLANDSDSNGDALTVTAVTQGANGTVTINADNTVKYTPNSGFTGSDSFTYTIGDGHGLTDTATVSVAVNDPSGFMDFSSSTFLNYAGQHVSGTLTVTNNGKTVNLSGNTWKAVAINYTITSNTVMEFDFSSSSEGEVHGIGLDTNLSLSSSYTFRVFGTQNWGRANYHNYVSGTKHYVIPVGKFYTGARSYLFFANDHDVSNPTAQSSFSNIKIYENSASAAPFDPHTNLFEFDGRANDSAGFLDIPRSAGSDQTHMIDFGSLIGLPSIKSPQGAHTIQDENERFEFTQDEFTDEDLIEAVAEWSRSFSSADDDDAVSDDWRLVPAFEVLDLADADGSAAPAL